MSNEVLITRNANLVSIQTENAHIANICDVAEICVDYKFNQYVIRNKDDVIIMLVAKDKVKKTHMTHYETFSQFYFEI
jgi:hypothetical protein